MASAHSPCFFVTAHSKGVRTRSCVSAHCKGLRHFKYYFHSGAVRATPTPPCFVFCKRVRTRLILKELGRILLSTENERVRMRLKTKGRGGKRWTNGAGLLGRAWRG